MNSVIILAGGEGKRLNSQIPKQFIKIDYRKIIDFSIIEFKKNKNIDEIILVFPKKFIDYFGKEYEDYKLTHGGKERYHSTQNGLLLCSEKSENILIHDAARPLISQKIIDNSINLLSKYDAVAPYIDIDDSLIELNTNIKYLDRSKIKSIQTPQSFKKKIFEKVIFKSKKGYTDDMSALINHNQNVNVKFFKGDKLNFKITTDIDLHNFKNILKNEK